MASPEDVILAKLEWSRGGGSDRQLRDASSIVRVQCGHLDLAYLRAQAGALGVTELLDLVLQWDDDGPSPSM